MRSCLLVLCTAWMVICARGLPTTTDTVFSLFPESETTRVSTTTFIANATETENVTENLLSLGLSTSGLTTESLERLYNDLEKQQSGDVPARTDNSEKEKVGEEERIKVDDDKSKIEVDEEPGAEEERKLRVEKKREQFDEEKRLEEEKRLHAEEERRKEVEQKRLRAEEAKRKEAERERLRAEEKRRKEEQERLRAEEERRKEAEQERLRFEEKWKKEEEKERLRIEKERRKEEQEKLNYVKHTPYETSVPATFVSTTFTSVETTFTPTNTRSPKSETLVPNLNAIGWTTSTPRQLCGRRTTRNGRIVGGDDTFPGDFPWAVSVRIVTVHHCGGTIINKYWVLTAAHCVKRYNARYFRVRPGILDVHEDKYLPKVDINVQEIVVHPDFGNPRRYSNDVALLKLKRPILFNLLTQPICLPLLRGEDFDGWNATVVGWGWLDEEEKERPTSLQRVTVPVLNNTICEKWYSEDYNGYVEIQDYQICAGYKEGGKDACRGDSGGPLVTKDRDNHFIIIGVVSAGVGCARKNLPGIYSRVSFFVPWILQVTGGFNGL